MNDKWNFDEVIDRRDSDSIKWDSDFLKEYFKGEDLLPLWVADMDFRSPQPVIDALINRAAHGIYGYSYPGSSEYYTSVISWFKRRYNWILDKEWFVFTPGVVPACYYIIQRFSHPGDKIIIQDPVYYPFANGIKNNGRTVVSNQLNLENNYYTMDFEDLEKKAKDPLAKLLILCSPHNPVSRVWTKDELKQLGEICIENNVLIIADEIHCDLTFPPAKHTVFATISEEFAQNSITCTAGSKTFNLAGLHHSNIIISNKTLREELKAQMSINGYHSPNVFGAIALQTAYDQCEDWLEALMKYLQQNFDFLKKYFQENLPEVSVIEPEGTYLIWLDFRKFNLSPKDLQAKLIDAKVALDPGHIFGAGGEGFERINIACPRATLKEALDRIVKALK
jgi:cystathionine beta-lyase